MTIASDVSIHLYHSNVLYLGCVKLLFWVHVNFLVLWCPMKSLKCLHKSLSQQCPISWVCKAAVLGPCQFSGVVVSIEESQLYPYISITAISSIFNVLCVHNLTSDDME
ncbi:hypothetical protein LAZ67_3003049 [Cordylochernes scorpioides]|uniref:Uncharacterized protein n=1 Tax=Cordylochernes scorpioides TaxID=51811 RepID=A0ABY6K8E3_9ARAC|nr:hypothetical protein LAZ67_3003049 [Cordylochernes scorpioides]